MRQKQAATCGRDLGSSECVDRRNLFRRRIEGSCDRTFAAASQRPALIGKTIKTVITENEMVEEPDAQ
jgi:hypothetical protein